MNDDMTLVRRYAASQSESAFAALVERYLDLVYSAAMRQVRDATAGVLDRTTLADLLKQVDAARAGKNKGEALMYYI